MVVEFREMSHQKGNIYLFYTAKSSLICCRLPFAACQKPNFSLIPYLILVSYRTILTFQIKSHPSPHVMSSHIASSPPHLLHTLYIFTTFSSNHSRVKKSSFPWLGTHKNPPRSLAKTLAQSLAQKIGPKLAKGQVGHR